MTPAAPAPLAVIRQRYSCRSYSGRSLPPSLRERVEALVEEPLTGPFGGNVSFGLLEFGETSGDTPRLGTYGFISGATLYLAGSINPAFMWQTDFGYCMQKLILRLTAMGLATCWLESTYDAGALRRRYNPPPGHVIPAVSPVGFSAARRSVMDRVVKAAARGGQRRPAHQLFFSWPDGTPLDPADAPAYADALEAVRLAPSAVNRQPWRVYVESDGGTCHFFSRGRPRLDLGIAMRNFEELCRHDGIPGTWLRLSPAPAAGSLQYVASREPSA